MMARVVGLGLALTALVVALALIAIMVWTSIVRAEWPDERARRAAALAAAEAARTAAETAQAEVEAQLAHVSALERSEGFDGLVMFNEQRLEPQGYDVSTGVRYVSAFEPVWTFAWCTLQLPSSGAEDRNLVLGRRNPGGPVMSPPVAIEGFARDRLTAEDIARARELCRWPEDVAATAPSGSG